MREEARAAWLSARFENGMKDCGHAWRGLRRSPAFTAVVVLTLALCIGATTAVYSIVRHVLLAPLPYPDANRIVSLESTPVDNPTFRPFAMNGALFQLYEARSRTLGDFAALVAVALASVGLFGIVAHAVARRKHEIGVRVALGAGPGVVGRLILGNGLRLAAVGCGLGILGAYAATRTLTTLLYAVSPPAPTILAGAVLLLLIIALIASLIPTRRALRIQPMDALRTD